MGPVIFLSLLYIAVYVVPIYWYPLSHAEVRLCRITEYVVWGLFVLDYAIQLWLSDNRRAFILREWLAFLFVAFPFFRPIRAIRGVIFYRQATTKQRSMVTSLPGVMAVMTILLLIVGGAAVLDVERFAPHATITTPSDALWWAVTEMTTSSNGSLSPVTMEGRLIAGFLLLFGLGLLTSMTGYVASWVLREFRKVESTENVE